MADKSSSQIAREQRLARQLRENLKRRKAQTRARDRSKDGGKGRRPE